MKHLIIASCIFAFVLGVTIVSETIMENNTKELITLSKELQYTVSNENEIRTGEILNEIEEGWEKVKKPLLLVLNHNDVDNVDMALMLTRASVAEWDKDICYQNASLLCFYLDELLDTEKLSLENIL